MVKQRIQSIDALRGFVMLLMLVDHAREFFFTHSQVSDPVNLMTTSPALFFTRLTAHLCAPIFVCLTGTAAWLYGQKKGDDKATSMFLLKRGLFLIFLELTLVNFGWSFSFPPEIVYLQVIWAIGLSMIALSVLLYLPLRAMIVLGLVIILGHNILDPITFTPGESGHALWSILHDRSMIDLPWGAKLRTSYPVLPWVGVILIGYSIGPLFSALKDKEARQKALVRLGLCSLVSFLILRTMNIYGDSAAWVQYPDLLMTLMSFVNLTKYPPSADFILLTLGLGLILLASFENLPSRIGGALSTFGSAPLFFYLVHIYLLNFLHLIGPESVPGVGWLWLIAAVLAPPLWFVCRRFSDLKKRSKSTLLSYL